MNTAIFGQVADGYVLYENNKIEYTFIEYSDWRTFPSKIKVKNNLKADFKYIHISEVKEFGVPTVSKFLRKKVNISDNLSRITYNPEVNFTQSTVFLEVLVEGNFSLFKYIKSGKHYYFFSESDSVPEQLVLHKFLNNNNQIITRENFKSQLFELENCTDNKWLSVSRLAYSEPSLVDYFIELNECKEVDYSVFDGLEIKPKFRLSIKTHQFFTKTQITGIAGIRGNSNVNTNPVFYDFGNIYSFNFGFELEYKIPYQDYKWSIFIEPYLQRNQISVNNTHSLNSENDGEIDYNSFNVPIGVRYYALKKAIPEFYLDGYTSLNFNGDSVLRIQNAEEVPINESLSFGFKIGYRFKSFQFEARFEPNRSLFLQEPRVKNKKMIWGLSIGLSTGVLSRT